MTTQVDTAVAPMSTAESTPAARRSGQPFRGDVEGLRAIAVLSVVLYHAGVPFLTGGFVGVDVFFVVSGFLITGLLLAEIRTTGRISIANFYARRVRRLLPAATVVLVASAVATWVLVPLLSRVAVGWDIVMAGLFSSNWRFAAQATEYGAFDQAPSPVLNYWSLGVEEQFYVVWPILLIGFTLLARRRGWNPKVGLALVVTAVAGASLWWSISLTQTDQPLAFFSSPARAWELAVGSMLALLAAQVARIPRALGALLGWAGLAAICWAAVTYSDSTLFPGASALVPVLGTAAVLAAGAAGGPTSRWESRNWLASGPSGYLGRRSYSWYLWHWPMLVFVAMAVGVTQLPWQSGLAVVAASFVVASVTLKYIENPARHPRGLIGGLRRTRTALLVGLLLTGVSVGAGWLVVSDTQELAAAPVVMAGQTPVLTPVQAVDDMGSLPAQCYGSASSKADCYYGKLDSTMTVALVGDSHSAEWLGAAQAAAATAGWRLQLMSMPHCPLADVTLDIPKSYSESVQDCQNFQREAFDRLVSERPTGVILAARNGPQRVLDGNGERLSQVDSRAEIAQGTATYVQRLTDAGIRVVVMRDTPTAPFFPPQCVTEHLDKPSECDFPLNETSLPDSEQLRWAVQAAGAKWVDPIPWVCPKRPMCSVVDGPLIKFRDDDHLTYTYSETLAGHFGRVLRRFASGS